MNENRITRAVRGRDPVLSQPYLAEDPMGRGPDPGDGINKLQLAWRKKYWLLAGALLGIGAGFAWVVFQPPLYSSTAVVEIVGINESFMGMNQLDPQAGTGSYTATAATIQTQVRVLMSASLRGRVVERMNIETTPVAHSPSGFFGAIRSRLGVIEEDPLESMKAAIVEAAFSCKARGVGTSRLIEITASTTSPEISSAYVNTLANEYLSQNMQYRTGNALRTTQWMEGQLEDTKARLERAENELQQYSQQSGNTFVLEQSTLADTKLRQLQSDLAVGQADRVTKQSRWEIARSRPIDSLPEILDDGRMRDLRTRITELRRERAQLLATLTTENPRVVRVDAQISELEGTLQREKNNLSQRIQNEYEAAVKREKLLSEAYAAQSRVLAAQGGRAARYAMLKRDAEMMRQAYNVLLQQMNQAAVVAAVPTTNLRVVDPGLPSKDPEKPRPIRDIPLAGFLGLSLTAGIVLGTEYLRLRKRADVFSDPGSLTGLLSLPELGVIPPLSAGANSTRGALFRRLRIDRIRPGSTELVKPGLSAQVDAFQCTLASLMANMNAGDRSVFVVSSGGPQEGKTTLISNLGATMAQIGRRVLLIDADMRRPRLHHVLQTPRAPGWRELILTEDKSRLVNLVPFLHPTHVPDLMVIPAGEYSAENPVGQLMFSPHLPAVFERLRMEFDVILIDTAPALAFPDARLLGRLSDGVILVVRAGVTSRATGLAAAQRFQQDRIPVIGTVLNDWEPSSTGGDAGYYYSSSYQDLNGKGKSG